MSSHHKHNKKLPTITRFIIIGFTLRFCLPLSTQHMRYFPMIVFSLMVSTSGMLPVRAEPTIPDITEQAKAQFEIKHVEMQSDTQHTYRIFIALPHHQPAPEGGYPVLYMLDGNAQFPVAVNSYNAKNGAAPLIIAVGYAIDKPYDVPARTRDYTPPTPLTDPDFAAGGEAEAFYQFLQSTVKPWVEANYDVNKQKQTLAGHSFGGLFTLYTLFNHTESFQRYVAASPSIWWGNGVVIPARTPLLATPPQSISVTAGENEDEPVKTRAGQPVDEKRAERLSQRKMVERAKTLANRLNEQGTKADFILFPGKGHGDVIPDAIGKAVAIAGQ
ncbi:putative esterase [Pectobacterium parmentieri WPP163]|nr:putative esterase [Pectobacterium parmentieri WPP163]POW24728.1 esterase [Pectobacterium parmentieri]